MGRNLQMDEVDFARTGCRDDLAVDGGHFHDSSRAVSVPSVEPLMQRRSANGAVMTTNVSSMQTVT